MFMLHRKYALLRRSCRYISIGQSSYAKEVKYYDSASYALRHLGPTEKQIEAMLKKVGVSNFDEMIKNVAPQQILFEGLLNMAKKGVPEPDMFEKAQNLSQENKQWRSYLGQGFYNTHTPSVVSRLVLENPGWVTQYTPYQAELSQGRLEQLLNWQTMVCDLTGLDVANASLLDEASAGAEAIAMAARLTKRTEMLIDSELNPITLNVMKTIASSLKIQLTMVENLPSNVGSYDLSKVGAVVFQYPDNLGHLREYGTLTSAAREAGCLSICGTDLLALCLIKAPGDFGTDIVYGSSQRFGVPLFCGGPHAAFFACRMSHVKQMPGRLVGISRDSEGRQALRLTLQTREQFIRKAKATSNICTAQALLANMAAFYAMYHGPMGLFGIARRVHELTRVFKFGVAHSGHSVGLSLDNVTEPPKVFDTVTFKPCVAQHEIRHAAEELEINLRYFRDGRIGVSIDETTTEKDINDLLSIVACPYDVTVLRDIMRRQIGTSIDTPGAAPPPIPPSRKDGLAEFADKELTPEERQQLTPQLALARDPQFARRTPYLMHENFNSFHSEAGLTRYIKQMERLDYSLVNGMIPLGSCTMKLNATTCLAPVSLSGFANIHPYSPRDQRQGTTRLVNELEEQLKAITGYDRFSFQPRSGAQGEYVGLRTIAAYLSSMDGGAERNVCLIPESSHGTNFASSVMAGFKTASVKTNADGSVSVDDVKQQIEAHGADKIGCLMITYPSTCGIFDDNIITLIDLIHSVGGQVYVDGANLNAQVGIARPADYGSDVSHLNLHKTFCIPHGGGGPGSGPIGVRSHLAPYLPPDPLTGRPGCISNAAIGSAAILPISWCYIHLMGAKSLRTASHVAILNANYMLRRLKDHFDIAYLNPKGWCAHEFILDCKPFKKVGITPTDIAKRLQDYSLHAPTVAWPYTFGLMIEPTESEDKLHMDQYVDALIDIRNEIREIEEGKVDEKDNTLRNAPHCIDDVTAEVWSRSYTRQQAVFPTSSLNASNKFWPPVSRIDDVYGDKNVVVRWPNERVPKI